MRIGIDTRSLMEGKRTGVEEYTINLLNHLFRSDQKNDYFLFYNAYKKTKVPAFSFPNVRVCEFHYPNQIFNLSLKFFQRPKIDWLMGGLDVFFSPNFRLLPLSKKCRSIITFHDLSFVKNPDFFSFKRRFWHFLMQPEKTAQNVSHLIAVSESTKRDLVRLYGVPEDKISVIYSGIDEEFKPRENNPQFIKLKNKYSLPEHFVLFLGTIEPRKNVLGAICAYAKIKDKIAPLKLVVAGIKGWLYKEIFQFVRKEKLEKDVFFTGFIKNADKPCLYNLASLFVFPSFYEGFGFPPLEAQASGCPVITSYNSSLPEVVKDGALLIDPYNIAELSRTMFILLTDNRLREKMIRKGLRVAKNFSWPKTAQETLEVLTKI